MIMQSDFEFLPLGRMLDAVVREVHAVHLLSCGPSVFIIQPNPNSLPLGGEHWSFSSRACSVDADAWQTGGHGLALGRYSPVEFQGK